MDAQDLDSPEFREYHVGDACPECEDGKIVEKYGRQFGGDVFLACNKYPRCEFIFNSFSQEA